MRTQNEQRKSRRIASLNLSYVCLDENGRAVKQGIGRTLNVSEAGILLETHFPIQPDYTIILGIGLHDEVVDIKGRPVHIRARRNGVHEVGIEFLGLDDSSRRILSAFMATVQGTGGRAARPTTD